MTDFFDGFLARRWSQQSSLGRMLDPIADKLLVSATLLMLAADETITGLNLVAAIIILCREILVSGLREFLAELRVPVPVTRLAKWKTTFQIVCLGALILGGAMPWWTVTLGGLTMNVPHTVGLTTLWAAAALTVVTGWDYLRVGLKHMD